MAAERRPDGGGIPDAGNVGTIVTAGTGRPPRCGALVKGHLTGCGNPPEPGSDRCAEHQAADGGIVTVLRSQRAESWQARRAREDGKP